MLLFSLFHLSVALKLKYLGAMLEQRQIDKYFCAKFNLSQSNASEKRSKLADKNTCEYR